MCVPKTSLLLFNYMKKIFLLLIFLTIGSFCFQPALAIENEGETLFTAQVTEVVITKDVERDDGSVSHQQHLKLIGLEGEYQDLEFEFSNLDFDVVAYPGYETGDKVYAYHGADSEGKDIFYIADSVRKNMLLIPAIIFALLVVLIGRFRGFRALLALVVSFVVILYFILPSILDGYNPLLITILGSVIILVVSFLITYGFKKKTYLSILATVIGLLVVAFTSVIFTNLLKLTGYGVEDAQFLVSVANMSIDVRGLLLAGMIIGAIGILTDVAISQVSLVQELVDSQKDLSRKIIFKKAMNVGVDHIGSMVNTLALAYAGAALPLLLLFSIDLGQYASFTQVINSEVIATEIIRTLVGSIGLILVVPLASWLGAVFYVKNKLT